MDSIVIAVDPSISSTGFAVFVNGKLTNHGNITTKKDGDNYYHRIHTILVNLPAFDPAEYYVSIALENQYLGVSPKVYGDLCGLRASIAMNYITDGAFDIDEYQPAAWRKIIGLKKDKTENWKQKSVDKVNELYNLDFKLKDNDKADAILIGLAHIEKYNK